MIRVDAERFLFGELKSLGLGLRRDDGRQRIEFLGRR
jgi:hypothetical protein